MKNKIITAIVLFVFNSVYSFSQLNLIEYYNPPNYPKSGLKTKELYDRLLSSGKYIDIPKGKREIFVSDIYKVLLFEFDFESESIKDLDKELVNKALDFLAESNWRVKNVYRPWTYFNFINSLSLSQRDKLVDDIISFAYSNGYSDSNRIFDEEFYYFDDCKLLFENYMPLYVVNNYCRKNTIGNILAEASSDPKIKHVYKDEYDFLLYDSLFTLVTTSTVIELPKYVDLNSGDYIKIHFKTRSEMIDFCNLYSTLLKFTDRYTHLTRLGGNRNAIWTGEDPKNELYPYNAMIFIFPLTLCD
jgi:hypothetical protein